ncbi:hypothetical protein Tco_0861331 [Tanacetum coccineum]|uniref:Uncharacterized protein n=1 Tax=Tanacetum coccineum TaxID=301880 RepID=A0ABQ5BN49_9ASTR
MLTRWLGGRPISRQRLRSGPYLTGTLSNESVLSQVFPGAEQERLKRVVTIPSAQGDWLVQYQKAGENFLRPASATLEILRDRDDYDRSERSDKRHKSEDRYQSDTQQNNVSESQSKNDRAGSDRNSGAWTRPKNRGTSPSTTRVNHCEITRLSQYVLKDHVHDLSLNQVP